MVLKKSPQIYFIASILFIMFCYFYFMVKYEYWVIGVMSGTSLDGVDLCYAYFQKDEIWNYKIICTSTISYSEEWMIRLKNAIDLNNEDLKLLNESYTMYLNKLIKDFISDYKIIKLDAICSHGHTVFHEPDKGLTYQIGNLSKIASGFKCPIICDFRVADVKLGGQGAPLVPIGDKLLFSDYGICLNLGGFANLSLRIGEHRKAYDICPVNIVLNYYAREMNLEYDDRGEIARSGRVENQLLRTLNKLEFYNENYPKSLGLEWVNQNIFPLIENSEFEIKDILRTFVEHIAIQISKAINQLQNVKVLPTGGGVYNTFLMERINDLTHNEIVISKDSLINYKEALIFGFLGVLKLRDEVNCLSSVTGAIKDHSSGVIHT